MFLLHTHSQKLCEFMKVIANPICGNDFTRYTCIQSRCALKFTVIC